MDVLDLTPLVLDLTPIELLRFWSKVDRSDIEGCWEWTGACCDGYGRVKIRTRVMMPHRVAAALVYREAPALHVLHTCDNPPCCNPNHLFFGTNMANCVDKILKGRGALRSSPFNKRGVKLTAAQIARIRGGEEGVCALAREFGVAPSTVSRTRTGKAWTLEPNRGLLAGLT